MKSLYLTAGHQIINGVGTGAFGVREADKQNKQFDEAVEARKLVNDIIAELKTTYKFTKVSTENDSWTLNSVISWIGKLITSSDYNIEIHFNAGDPKATGAEVFISTIYNLIEKDLCNKLSALISTTLGIKNRGLKTDNEGQHSKLGILSSDSLKKGNNLLIEICFITNENDVKSYRKNYTTLVKNLAKALYEELSK